MSNLIVKNQLGKRFYFNMFMLILFQVKYVKPIIQMFMFLHSVCFSCGADLNVVQNKTLSASQQRQTLPPSLPLAVLSVKWFPAASVPSS